MHYLCNSTSQLTQAHLNTMPNNIANGSSGYKCVWCSQPINDIPFIDPTDGQAFHRDKCWTQWATARLHAVRSDEQRKHHDRDTK
jgi:hypothetical protein